MTPDFPERDELRALLNALCEETITPEQVRRIEELVLSRPEAEAFYVQYVGLHADLVRHFRGLPEPAAVAEPPRAEPRPNGFHRRRLLAWAVGIGGLAGLAAAVLVAVWLWPRPQAVVHQRPAEPAGEATDDTVAVLLQTHRAEWEDTGLPTRPGAPLRPGRLVLKSGFAQIEFYSGATVILEGPADFKLVSRTEAYCARGKLRATVPAQAQGFTIGAPKLDLVDRGTEFGLDVGERTRVHVFQGKVDVYDPETDHKRPPRRELTTGQGVSLDGPGAGLPIAADPAAFLTARELADRAARAIEERQREWADASAALRRDPSLLVYYTFQSDPPWSRTLPDESRGREKPHDGAVVGCSWGAGRWPGRRALEFKRVSDRVRFTVPGEFASVTMAAWVRPDALPNQNNSLMLADGWDPGAPHWQIGSDGTLILGVRGPPDFHPSPNVRGAQYRAYNVLTPERFGRWVHLAIVYDQEARRVTHYVDGRPVMEEPMEVEIPIRIGDAELGNWNVAGFRNKNPVRNFNGCIDEFLLFSRPLSGAEVERLYLQGRPPL